MVEAIIDGVEILGDSMPVPADIAYKTGLRKRGRPKKGEEIKGVHSTLMRGSTMLPISPDALSVTGRIF